ncbi:hypothetical protein L7F22_059758 [Adiantum nelumboides]|nr:hypothetical protein [Adiantum nelumboides]
MLGIIKAVDPGYLLHNASYLLPLLLPLPVTFAAEVVGSRPPRNVDIDINGTMATWSTIHVFLFSIALVYGVTMYFMSTSYPTYLIDFSCFKATKKEMCSHGNFLRFSSALGVFDKDSMDLQRRICERSGLGDESYLPPAVLNEPPNPCMAEARIEAERVMFGSIDELFQKTGVHPKDVGILIVNCSLFVPTPSLCATIVNHYNMRSNIQSVNLGGMGCSAGVISIDLAKHLLRSHRNTTALVMTMENITLNWYWGNDKSKLVSNCIFRMGGAAVLLSNKWSMRSKSKYELMYSVRTHRGANDTAYSCVFQEEDENKNVGVSLSKELMKIAGNALKINITSLGPLVLPLSEQMWFFGSLLLRRFGRTKMKLYIPNFKLAFEHFCVHAGGRAVLDEVEKSLDLSEWHLEGSRMTLFRFGNTSSSSLWYELAYMEAKGRVKKGDRVWQIAFGSGFKCNSAVWRSLRSIKPKESTNVWSSFIDEFPVKVPSIAQL